MSKKILELENCLECNKSGCHFFDYCNDTTIPNGCPLPAKPEPLTGKELRDKFMEVAKDLVWVEKPDFVFAVWEEMTSYINAHFLGCKE